MSSVLLTAVHGPAVLRRYDADSLDHVISHLHDLGGDGPAQAAHIQEARSLPGFALITASVDARLVGYAVAAVTDGVVRIDPLVVSAAVDAPAAADITADLVDALITATDLPWADVALPADSPGLAHLLRNGWQPTPTGSSRNDHLVLSGARATA